jgi:hypothetical protein
MKTVSLKKMSIPKIAVLATGLTAAIVAVTVSPQAAQAFPTKAANCTGCHAAGGATTAAPSTLTPAAGAAYTVAITLTANPAGGNSGYAIVPVAPAVEKTNGGNVGADTSFTATMTAPAAAGTYTYNVYTNQGLTDPAGQASGTTYSITVAPVATTPPVTTPPVTTPPVTTPPVTAPPVTTPPVTTPPVTTPPVTTPPVTTPPVTTPPVTTPPVTTPPVTKPTATVPPVTKPTTTVPPVTTPAVNTPSTSVAHIRSLSPTHAAVGAKVTIRGTGFAKAGTVKFGNVTAKVSSWTKTAIVVKVPARSAFTIETKNGTVPVWYRGAGNASVTVTPKGASASNAAGFRLDSNKAHGDEASQRAHHDARH